MNLLPSTHDPKHGLLASVPGLGRLRRKKLERLSGLLDILHFDTGDTLIRQGALAREFLVVVDGHATVERDGTAIGNVGPGAFVGEMALLAPRGRRSATVRALEPMTVLLGDSRVLDAVLDVDDDLRSTVVRTAEHRAARNRAA